jgi:hypothetical protein
MHMQRLRNIKPCIDMKKPPKPKHIVNNYKKELNKMERMSEIQYQNRVLLKKMLQIDMKPSSLAAGGEKVLTRNNSAHPGRPASAKSRVASSQGQSQGLNAYNSLNRANRIRSLAKIIDENKVLLDKLQKTKSQYDNEKWRHDYIKNVQL